MTDVIKSVYYDQSDILKSIMKLCGLDRFCVDATYGNGKFYGKGVPEPVARFDLDPQFGNVIEADSCRLPLPSGGVKSFVFDPPFLTYIRAAREGNGGMVMARRFGGYWKYDELEAHYVGTIKEAHRVLCERGILVFKCQDLIHNHKMHCTHVNVINWCDGLFRLKDMYVLPVKHRMGIPSQKGVAAKKQKHARIFHSYFLVLEKISKLRITS